MRIKNQHLILDDTDLDKLVVYKLKELERTFENFYDEIASRDIGFDKVSLFADSQNELDAANNLMNGYIKDLKYDKKITRPVFNMLEKIEAENVNPVPEDSQVLIAAMRGIEKYAKDKIDTIIQDIDFNKSLNPRVKRCLDVIEAEKTKNALASHKTKTPWQNAFRDFALSKKNNNGTNSNTILQNQKCLETVFEIINKQYVENINHKDCQIVSDKIHNLPRKWKEKHPDEKLLTVLERDNQDIISKTTVKKYLRALKEFLAFCKKRRIITDDFSDTIEISKRKETIEIEGFNRDELKAIFNPSFYPKKGNIYHSYRFWIPLIALYTGMRLNEICQLYVDDVKYENKVWYFVLTDERKDQHLKNKQSKRNVPIHHKLIELGFIDFVKEIRAAKKSRLFYQLKYCQKNHYANAMSGWFARHLKDLGLKDKNKVFHSFRHTVKPYLRDAGISQEYQNQICGWTASDIGERVYGGRVPIKKLYQEISKLDYPFLENNFKEIINLNK